MTDKTAFEQWWANHFGVEWYQHYEFENKNCKSAWNAAIDAAAFKCDTVESDEIFAPDEIADECKKSILKLKSE